MRAPSGDSDEVRWQVKIDDCAAGPFGPEEMADLYLTGVLTSESLIRQMSWVRWRKCADILAEFLLQRRTQVPSPQVPPEQAAVARRLLLPPGSTDVLIHDQTNLIRTLAFDISRTGMFMAGAPSDFCVSEVVSLTFKAADIIRPFRVRARVVRFNSDYRYPIGYGLEFVEVPPALQLCSKLD